MWIDKLVKANVINRWKYHYANKQLIDINEIQSMLEQAYEESMSRLVGFLNGRQDVLPLSGGHDTRLIAYCLKNLPGGGDDNIITYSYGKVNNEEYALSEKVAEALGIL